MPLFLLLGVAAACGTSRSVVEEEAEESYVEGPTVVRNAPDLPPRATPVFARGRPSLSLLVVGDQGWQSPPAVRVVAAMARKAERAPIDFVLMTGDNFYRKGVASVDDVQWKTMFEDRYATPALAVPFYAVLGNHDRSGNEEAQVEYSAHSTRWRMPAEHYGFRRDLDAGEHADFFVLDTDPLAHGRFGSGKEIDWLEELLRASTARWKIVVGHHTVRSHGAHGDTPKLVQHLEPLFVRYGVDLYVCGHDHDQQLIDAHGCLYLVSGAGSGPRDTSYGDGSLFASADPGFAWIGMTAEELWIEIVSADHGELFAHRLAKAPAKH